MKALRARTDPVFEGPDRIEHDLERCRAEYREFLVREDTTVHNLLNDHYDADVSLDPGSESARFKLRLMEGVVGFMAEVADRHRVPVLLMAIPSAVDVCENHLYGRVDFRGHDNHWSDEGQALAARVAAEEVLRRALLDRSGPVVSTPRSPALTGTSR